MLRNHIIYSLFIILLALALLPSCEGREASCVTLCDVAVDITLTVPDVRSSVHANGSSATSDIPMCVLPDPGIDHGEWATDSWAEMVLFFVYNNGNVIHRTISNAKFMKTAQYTESNGYVNNSIFMTILTGHISHIYAVAFGDPQSSADIDASELTIDYVKNFTTVDLGMLSDGKARRNYLISLFSGVNSQGFDVDQSGAVGQRIHVVLNRLAAKVDIQYDLAKAYENAEFVEPSMSAISFNGFAQGFFFPDMKTVPDNTDNIVIDKLSSNIAKRNGRVVFYTLPGLRNSFSFDIDFSTAEQQKIVTYEAQFQDALKPTVWYKVNFNVSGASLPNIESGSNKVSLSLSKK